MIIRIADTIAPPDLNGRPILDSQVEESITTAVPFPPSATSDADRLPDSSPLLGPAPAPTSALETSRPSTPPSPQTQIRNLTLPPFPNLSIPPSPPSSPNPATEAKIASLLALRRAGGPSLNDKLASSRAFANPGLFPQLLKAFGLDEEGAQHAGTLKAGGLDGTGVPEWMFKDGLEKLRREVWEEGERVKKGREKVEFVKERVKR